MALSSKTLKTRIRSVRNIGKITKAMELVSATKMRRAVKATLAARPYAAAAAETAAALAVKQNGGAIFFTPRSVIKKVTVVILAGNRGLCGSFNTQVVAAARNALRSRFGSELPAISWIAVGKKGLALLTKSGEKVSAELVKADSLEKAEEFFALGRYLTKQFIDGEIDEVMLAYTDFRSVLKQTPKLKTILPISSNLEAKLPSYKSMTEFMFEPNKTVVINYLVPRLIETELYQALLESNASEEAARMMAMKNAAEAAGELADDLILTGNQLRQAMITREIAEIAAASN